MCGRDTPPAPLERGGSGAAFLLKKGEAGMRLPLFG